MLNDYGWGTTVEMDLIDTQWNVNVLPVTYAKIFEERFNRYIVECKSVDCGSITLAEE